MLRITPDIKLEADILAKTIFPILKKLNLIAPVPLTSVIAKNSFLIIHKLSKCRIDNLPIYIQYGICRIEANSTNEILLDKKINDINKISFLSVEKGNPIATDVSLKQILTDKIILKNDNDVSSTRKYIILFH